MSEPIIDSSLQVTTSRSQIIKIALPISFAILIPQLNFITNNVFLGHYSDQALAVAGVTGVFYLIFAAIGFGLNNGMQALISRRAGENRPEEIGKIFNQGVFISLVIALMGIILTYTLVPHVFKLFISDSTRYNKAVHFLYIRIWGLPFLYIYQMRNALLVGTNQSKYLVAGNHCRSTEQCVTRLPINFWKIWLPPVGLQWCRLRLHICRNDWSFCGVLGDSCQGYWKTFQTVQ